MSEVTMWDDHTPITGKDQPEPKKITGPRLTVVQNVYHQRPNMEPTQHEHRWDCELHNDEQPFYREKKIGPEEYHKIETGWIENPGTILIENKEGKFFDANPTPEEREVIKDKVLSLEVSDKDQILADFIIVPGDCMRLGLGSLYSLHNLKLSTLFESSIRYSVTIYPR